MWLLSSEFFTATIKDLTLFRFSWFAKYLLNLLSCSTWSCLSLCVSNWAFLFTIFLTCALVPISSISVCSVGSPHGIQIFFSFILQVLSPVVDFSFFVGTEWHYSSTDYSLCFLSKYVSRESLVSMKDSLSFCIECIEFIILKKRNVETPSNRWYFRIFCIQTEWNENMITNYIRM